MAGSLFCKIKNCTLISFLHRDIHIVVFWVENPWNVKCFEAYWRLFGVGFLYDYIILNDEELCYSVFRKKSSVSNLILWSELFGRRGFIQGKGFIFEPASKQLLVCPLRHLLSRETWQSLSAGEDQRWITSKHGDRVQQPVWRSGFPACRRSDYLRGRIRAILRSSSSAKAPGSARSPG